MTILILGGADDDHAMHVHQYLTTHGHDVEFLDSRDFPACMQVEYDPLSGSGAIYLPGGREVPIGQIQSVYWRSYHGVGGVELPDEEQAHIARNDARSLFESLLIALPCRWVNGWQAFQLHQTKPAALRRVAENFAEGPVKIPATLLGNHPAAVRAFAEDHPHCIFKPIQGGAHTQRLQPEHLSDENLASLAVAPVTLQEEAPGTNIRVFVAGSEVMACEIATDAIDFRDGAAVQIAACNVPQEVAEQSRRIARTLALLWTGIDYRRTPAGEYYFLEANPSPMFLGFEERTGLPLTAALARLLTSGQQG